MSKLLVLLGPLPSGLWPPPMADSLRISVPGNNAACSGVGKMKRGYPMARKGNVKGIFVQFQRCSSFLLYITVVYVVPQFCVLGALWIS